MREKDEADLKKKVGGMFQSIFFFKCSFHGRLPPIKGARRWEICALPFYFIPLPPPPSPTLPFPPPAKQPNFEVEWRWSS